MKCDNCGEKDAIYKLTLTDLEGLVIDAMSLCALCHKVDVLIKGGKALSLWSV